MFAQTNTCTAAIAAGNSCTVSVTFTPTSVGAKSASLMLSTNAAVSPTVALSGTGTFPAVLAQYVGNLGGPGTADGPRATARFFDPVSVAADSSGNIYVADSQNFTVRKITPDGSVSTVAGLAGTYGSADGTGSTARFHDPWGMATDGAGNVYVADSGNSAIRKITPAGIVSTLAGAGIPGSADGTGSSARFNVPWGVATDSTGNVYVADTGNDTIRKVTPAGVVSTFAGTAGAGGAVDATGAAARFKYPYGVTTDNAGNVYVADTLNYTIRKITPAGSVSTIAGLAGSSGSADGIGTAARFTWPEGVVTDTAGNVYVTDTFNYTIRKVTPDAVVTTIAGPIVPSAGYVDGTGSGARFTEPDGIAIDSADNLYVADSANDSIRKVTPAGAVSTFSGMPAAGGYLDGIGAATRFNSPSGIAADRAGNVYVADMNNQSIRAITPEGVVSTLAGAAYSTTPPGPGPPLCQSTDGSGAAARFCFPQGVAIDNAGNVYVADTQNSIVRKIAPTGAVSTLGGLAGTDAGFSWPSGVATDSAGNVYVADTGNCTIRKITPAGVVSTLAGTARACGSVDGTGSASRFNFPQGVATDNAGSVYVADTNNFTIRKITPAGVVSTLAGAAGIAGSADGMTSSARFNSPSAIAIDSTDNLYIADTASSTIRKITPAGVVTTVVGISGQAGFTPGALPGVLALPLGVAISGNSLFITLYNGVAVVGLP
jgi:sugar lactone lactonase YvrE